MADLPIDAATAARWRELFYGQLDSSVPVGHISCLQAMKQFHIDAACIHRLRKAGMPCSKRGRRVWLQPEVVESWLQKQDDELKPLQGYITSRIAVKNYIISRSSLRRLMASGMPYIKRLGRFYYRPMDVARWLGQADVHQSQAGPVLGIVAGPEVRRERQNEVMLSDQSITLPLSHLDTMTEAIMVAAVARCGGSIAAAAKCLRISRKTIYHRLKRKPPLARKAKRRSHQS